MRIATRLAAVAVFSLLLTLVIIGTLAWQNAQQQKHYNQLEEVFSVQASIDSLRSQLLIYSSNRDIAALKRGYLIDTELRTLLSLFSHSSEQQQIYLQSLIKQNNSISYLLTQAIELHSTATPVTQDQASQHLISLLSSVVQSMTEDSIRLEYYALERSKTLNQQSMMITAGLLLTFTLILAGMSSFTSRHFKRRLAVLDDGIHSVSSGATHTQISTEGRDEFSEVAAHFNQMTERLQATTISRDQLQIEVDKRTEQLEVQKQTLKLLADHDQLTNLPNRAYFRESLQNTITKNQRSGESAAIFFMDLDKFKQINDTLGHHVGDEVLLEVAHRFKMRLRRSDFIARLGGDEFTVIIDPVANPQSAAEIANQLLICMKPPLRIGEHKLHLRTSIGISLYPEDGIDVSTLMRNADLAMYKAKEDGGNRFHFYTKGMTQEALEKISLEEELRQALAENQFFVHYQPQYSLNDKELVGIEALVRWQHPTRGILEPQEFIPLAEERGLIQSLGMRVLEIACSQCSQWLSEGFDPGVLAVNISARQLNQLELPTQVQDILSRTHWPADRLELEVTESFFIKDTTTCLKILNQLKELGVMLSIDDFGTGYSSLSYLKQLPISKLKIDRSFTRHLTDDAGDRAISVAIIALGKSLGLQVIAEGVEQTDQEDILIQEGCDQVQGFLYGKPLPAEEFTAQQPAVNG